MLSRRAFLASTAATAAVAALPPVPAVSAPATVGFSGLKVDHILHTVPHDSTFKAFSTIYFKDRRGLRGALSTEDPKLIKAMETHLHFDHSLTMEARQNPPRLDFTVEDDDEESRNE